MAVINRIDCQSVDPNSFRAGAPQGVLEVLVMPQTYRVRYSLKHGEKQCAKDGETLDIQGYLDHIPGSLPQGAYILYVEDLTGGRDVHWTRWPKAYRPGFGG